MTMVTVFPAVSTGAVTPGAHDVETRVVENFRARYERPVQIQAAALPLIRPFGFPACAGALCGRSQRQDGRPKLRQRYL
jgi:hypothetical protein